MSGGWVVFNSSSSRCSVGGFRVSLMRCVVRTHSSSLPSGLRTRRRLPVAGFFFGVPWATVTSQLVTRRASLSHAASGPRSSTRPLGSCSITRAAWCGQGRLRWLCWPRAPSRLPGRRGSFFSAGAAAWGLRRLGVLQPSCFPRSRSLYSQPPVGRRRGSSPRGYPGRPSGHGAGAHPQRPSACAAQGLHAHVDGPPRVELH